MLGVDEERALLSDLPVPAADRWLQLLYQCVTVFVVVFLRNHCLHDLAFVHDAEHCAAVRPARAGGRPLAAAAMPLRHFSSNPRPFSPPLLVSQSGDSVATQWQQSAWRQANLNAHPLVNDALMCQIITKPLQSSPHHLCICRAKGKAYGREQQLLSGLDDLEAAPAESSRGSGGDAMALAGGGGAPTPMQTGAGFDVQSRVGSEVQVLALRLLHD